ncbi:MAG: hypothetical protein ACOX09_03545 [Candidatus Kapaibacterium sp.]|jgi:hypothetical protein
MKRVFTITLMILLALTSINSLEAQKKARTKKTRRKNVKVVVLDSVFQLKGLGTADSPFIISNLEDLNQLSKVCQKKHFITSGKYFKQTRDISISGTYSVIGTKDKPFNGNYDGGGYKVVFSNNINFLENNGYFGIFGVNEGEIANIFVSGEMDVTYNKHNVYVGAIAGLNKKNISQCCNHAKIVAAGNNGSIYLGGIAGRSDAGKIIDCYNANELFGNSDDSYCGGITGWNSTHSTVENCYSSGEATGYMVGGTVGMNYGLVKKNYYLTFSRPYYGVNKQLLGDRSVNVIGNDGGGEVIASRSRTIGEMQSADFALALSEQFKYDKGFPKLVWEKSEKKAIKKKRTTRRRR